MRWSKTALLLIILAVLLGLPTSGICSAPRLSPPLLTDHELPRYIQNGAGVVKISNRTVPSSLLRKLLFSTKSICLEDVKIVGDLRLSDKHLNTTIVVRRSGVLGALAFSGVTFQAPVDFTDCTFCKDVIFRSCIFEKDAFFRNPIPGTMWSFDCVFQKPADFTRSVFKGSASFIGAEFDGCTFAYVAFRGQSDFRRASFGSATFYGAEFSGSALFDDARLTSIGVVFDNAFFAGRASFQRLGYRGSGMASFVGTTFEGRAYFNDARLDVMDFGARDQNSFDRIDWADEPVMFAKPVFFDRLRCQWANFRQAEFCDYASFYDAQFTKFAWFDEARFDGTVDLTQACFPVVDKAVKFRLMKHSSVVTVYSGLSLDRTQFNGQALLLSDQLFEQRPFWSIWPERRPKLSDATYDTWAALEQLFARSNDLRGRCEAYYQKRLAARSATSNGLEPIAPNMLSQIFWGYGVRPWRLVGWIIVVSLLFTYVYWTQTRPLAKTDGEWGGRWGRIRYALVFSLNTCCPWKPGYGYQRSLARGFRLITALHYLVFLLLLLCLMNVLSSVNPVMRMMVGKLLQL